MVDKETTTPAPKEVEASPPPQVPEPEEIEETSNPTWQFLDREPTMDEVLALLKTVKYMGKFPAEKYIDYVAAISQNKKIKVPHPTKPDVDITLTKPMYSLYMSVAGRIKILNDIQTDSQYEVKIYPEPAVSTGAPGYIRFDDKLVFRAYVDISDGHGKSLGSRFGTAWVPAVGGSNAAATNPFEKVETSALGRAIAQWGIGILPGSGIASLEEMRSMQAETAAQQRGGGSQQRSPGAESREDMIEDLLTTMEKVRQRRNYTDEKMLERLRKYSAETLGRPNFVTDDGFLDWGKLKDAQIALMRNMFKTVLQEIMDEDAPV